ESEENGMETAVATGPETVTPPPTVAGAARGAAPREEGGKSEAALIEIKDVNLFYGPKQALHSISLSIPPRQVTAFIGPSGCGKSTLLRCLNRMNDLVDGVRIEGSIKIHGDELNTPGVDVVEVRKRFGMVFQKSNPFPKSIYENVVYGLRIQGVGSKRTLDE